MKQKYSQKDTKKERQLDQNKTEVQLEDTKKEDSQNERKTVRYFKRQIDWRCILQVFGP